MPGARNHPIGVPLEAPHIHKLPVDRREILRIGYRPGVQRRTWLVFVDKEGTPRHD